MTIYPSPKKAPRVDYRARPTDAQNKVELSPYVRMSGAGQYIADLQETFAPMPSGMDGCATTTYDVLFDGALWLSGYVSCATSE
jgi:hypothetical protein